MDYSDSVSLTRSCIVHKPNKGKKKSSSYVSSEFNKTKFPLWEEIASKIKLIEKKSCAETFEDLLLFIQNCLKFPLKESYVIKAAVLIMGVNMSDHSSIFHLLETYLHINDVYTTVILESKKCHSFSHIVQTIQNQLIRKYEQFLNIESCLPKKDECSFGKLYEFYQSVLEKVTNNKRSPRKKQRNVDVTVMPIVILIQDVENFNTELLKRLVIVTKLYADRLPIILVFGMASTLVNLYSILPHEAYLCLKAYTFHSVPAIDNITKIIDEIIISPDQPFKLGPKVFKLIVDIVLYYDFSISNLSYLLKYSLLEHLHGNSLATLCCHESEVHKNVNDLRNEDLQTLRTLPSFKEYIDNNPNIISCFNKPSNLKEFVINEIFKLFHGQKEILILLKLLHLFVKDLPEYPLGKQLRELYSLALEKQICMAPAYNTAEKLLRMQSQNNLSSKLKSGIDLLKEAECNLDSSIIRDARNILEEYFGKLSNLTTHDFDKNTQDPMLFQTDKITSRHQLQERIQLSIKMKRSNYEALRNEIVDNLTSIFKYIRPPSSFPFYEIFYFDGASSVKQHLLVSPRVTICQALANPHHYLKCNCCKTKVPEETRASMPDVSLLYKLHLESGKLINLCDWLEALKAIKNGGVVPKRSKAKAQEAADTELNIRFLHAVSELQLLGFVKPTKRKTDHVARLTFGVF